MKPAPPVLVDLALLGSGGAAIPAAVLRAFAKLNRADRPLVLIGERPDRWAPTRSRVDRALEGQSRIEREVHRAGGVLDAVLYLDLGLFSRRRKRDAMLADLAERYGVPAAALIALVATEGLADAIRSGVGEARVLDAEDSLEAAIRALIET